MEKAIDTSATGHGHGHDHDHVNDDTSSGSSKAPMMISDQRNKNQLPASSNSDSETDVQSFITQPFPKLSDANPDAIPVVDFSSAEMAHLQAQHQRSLFAKVLGKKVGFHRLSSHLNRVLNPEGSLDVIPLENDFFLLKFSHGSDYEKALQGVPWMIDRHYITLHPWSPNFKPSEAKITRAAVWIRLPELPVEYYAHEALPRIAAAIGRLIKIDPVTELRLKCKFARLCVELDLHRSLPNCVKLPNGVWQCIQYEGLNLRCDKCRRFGHLSENCSYQTSFSTPESTSPPEPSASDDPSRYGPLPQVSRAPQLLPQLTYHPGDVTGTECSASGSGFQARGDEPSPGKDVTVTTSRAIHQKNTSQSANLRFGEASSSSLSNAETFAQNRPVPTSSTQSQEIEEGTRGEIKAAFQVFSEYFPPSSPTFGLPLLPVPTPYQGGSRPPTPSGAQSVSPAGLEMYLQAIQRAVEKREINAAPVEIRTPSNQGCPTVLDIHSKVSELAINAEISPSPIGHGSVNHITIEPKDLTENATPGPSAKKMLSWNCRGASDAARIRAINGLCEAHNPSILLLMETKTSWENADRAIKGLGFSGSYCIDPVGDTGGVWLLWRKECVQVNITSSTAYQIHAFAKFSPAEGFEAQEWNMVYGVDSD